MLYNKKEYTYYKILENGFAKPKSLLFLDWNI